MQRLKNCSKEDKMSMLVLGTCPSNEKEEFMQEIKASILKRSGRKYWYIRYQVIFNNQKVSKQLEESTKVGQHEKSLMYMQEVYLPAWIKQKKEELHTKSVQDTSFKHYASLYHDIYTRNRDIQNMKYRLDKILLEFSNKDMTSITKLEVKIWLLQLKNVNTQEELSKSTRNNVVKLCNTESCIDQHLIISNYVVLLEEN